MASPCMIEDDTPREIAMIEPKLRETIRRLAKGELPWPLFLSGAAGRGKSAAALCLADHVYQSAYFRFTMFLRACELARKGVVWLRRWRRQDDLTGSVKFRLEDVAYDEPKFWRMMREFPLVVVDDIATRGGYTEPQYDHLYDLIEERSLKPLVLVSNLSLKELGGVFDDRIISRIARGTVFTLDGADRRLDRK